MMNQTNQTDGDYLYGLAIASNFNESKTPTIFAAKSSGLYLSKDGKQWQLATESLAINQPYTATAVALAPENDGERTIVVGLAGGILQSSDWGKNWKAVNIPSPPPVVSSLVFSPSFIEDGVILAGTLEDGVLRSADRGNNWVAWNFGLLDLGVMSLAISPRFSEDETVFAGTETGVFYSTNGGRAWKEVNLPCGFEPVMCMVTSPSFGSGGKGSQVVFAGTETQGLFRSEDRGKHWEKIGNGFLQGNLQSIQIDPAYPDIPSIIVVSGGNVYITNDDGENWSVLWSEITSNQPACIVLAPEGLSSGNTIWLGMTDGQVFKLKV